MLITAPRTAQIGNAASFQTKCPAILCALGNLHVDRSIERRNLYRSTERSFDEGNRHFNDDIVAAALKELMRLYDDIYVKVAIAAAVRAGIAAA